MHFRTILVLLLAVGALGALALLGGDDEGPTDASAERPILPGLEVSRVTSLRVDYTDRELTFEVQRDRGGRWFLVDPIAYRADDGPILQILDLLQRERAEPVPGMVASEAGLTPGRVEIEVTEELAEDELRRRSIQLGAVDLGGRHVFALVPAREGVEEVAVHRVALGLSSTLELPLDEWRQRRLFDATSRDVIGLRRRGTLPELDGSFDPAYAGELDLDVELEGDAFYATYPYRVRLHPAGIEPLRLATTGARALRFLDDDPTDLGRWGLEPPAFTLEVDLRGGGTTRLRFGSLPLPEGISPDQREWTVIKEGGSTVMELGRVDVQLLTASPEQLFDYDVINVRDSDVSGLVLTLDGARLELDRAPSGWSLESGDEVMAADGGAVADLVGSILNFELDVFLTEPEHREQPLAGRLAVRRLNGDVVGGDLGPRTTYRGLEGRLFRREGEDLWGLMTADLESLANTDPLELVSLEVARLSELDQAMIVLRAGAADVRWERDLQRGLWRRAGSADEDRDFALEVERLIAPRVRRWLDMASTVELDDRIDVDVVAASGGLVTYALGRVTVDGEPLTVLRSGARTGEVPAAWLKALAGFLES